MEYCGIEGLTNKTHKLNINKRTYEYMLLPIQDNNPTPSFLAGSLKRYLEKIAPG